MPDTDEGEGMVVLGEDEIVMSGEVCPILIEDVWVFSKHPDLSMQRGSPFIDRNELFMEVIKGSPCRL